MGASVDAAGPEPEGTGDLLHLALESLYDNAALATSQLGLSYPWIAALPGPAQRAQALRSLLMDAVEALRPPWRSAAHTQPARDYEVLSLRYVSGLTVEQIAAQLCVGSRQIYRDLRRAEDKLGAILRMQTASQPTETVPGAPGDRTSAEPTTPAPAGAAIATVDLRELAAVAVRAVRPLAAARGVAVTYSAPPAPVLTRGALGLLRTAITELLSAAVQSGSVAIALSLDCEDGSPRVVVTLSGEPDDPSLHERLSGARAAGLQVRLQPLSGGRYQLVAALAAPELRRVVVVEDSPSACELYSRYLEGSGWQVAVVTEGAQAVGAVRAARPNAIILDVMMEDLDGWSILEELRLDPLTADIPAIVCSVVHDPGLATALGARVCLAKPVSRSQLLAALRQVQAG